MTATLKTAATVVLALSFALPALAATPKYGDNAPIPASGKAVGNSSKTATQSSGGAGIQTAQQAQRVTNQYHAGKTGPATTKGYSGSNGAGSAALAASR